MKINYFHICIGRNTILGLRLLICLYFTKTSRGWWHYQSFYLTKLPQVLGGCSVIINIQALGASYLGCCCLEICIPSPTSNFRFLENIFAQINVDDKNTVVRIVLNFTIVLFFEYSVLSFFLLIFEISLLCPTTYFLQC